MSDPAQAALVGTGLAQTLTVRFTAKADSAFYGVSDFVLSPLYGGAPAYIYGAPILHPTEPGSIVGGIAIVFDTTPQRRSILVDSAPVGVDAQPVPGSGLVFVDDRRRVLSATCDDHPVGSAIALPDALFAVDGRPRMEVLTWRGGLYATGICASSGYRECKGEADCYRHTVFAICWLRLCDDGAVGSTDVIDRDGRDRVCPIVAG